MRRLVLPVAALALLLLLVPSASAISVTRAVTFQPSSQMTVHWDATTALDRITLTPGAVAFNNYSLAATGTVGITITDWPITDKTRSATFTFLANTTEGTSVQFILTVENASGWTVFRDGVEYAEGIGSPIAFTNEEWSAGVDRTFTVEVGIASSEEVAWLIQFGAAWLTLLVALAFLGVIVASFVGGFRRRRRSGKIWKYMPKKWRRR